MNRELLVFVQRAGRPVPCGRLWTREGPRVSASFEYERSWIGDGASFALDPELPVGRGQFHTALPLFRAFTDPAPDRWGQTLLRRAERSRARREGRAVRTLGAVDFLVLVDDETRLGALRFKDARYAPEVPFLSSAPPGKSIPPLVDLPRLLSASNHVIAEDETPEDLALLLAPGTSLGGARPKASVRAPDGQLMIAKFPRKDDDWPVTRWEATTLALAQAAGIRVPAFRLELVAKKPVLILSRFDRAGGDRISFMSGMTAASADDHDVHSYLELADFLRREGSRVSDDLLQLWRRLVFNLLVSNTDDHLRNHGFLRGDVGWRLAPAYDLNPTPIDVKPRVHALAINQTETDASLDTAFEAAPGFGLTAKDARSIAREVAKVVQTWRTVGTKFGLGAKDLDRMRSAFEHDDPEKAAVS